MTHIQEPFMDDERFATGSDPWGHVVFRGEPQSVSLANAVRAADHVSLAPVVRSRLRRFADSPVVIALSFVVIVVSGVVALLTVGWWMS